MQVWNQNYRVYELANVRANTDQFHIVSQPKLLMKWRHGELYRTSKESLEKDKEANQT